MPELRTGNGRRTAGPLPGVRLRPDQRGPQNLRSGLRELAWALEQAERSSDRAGALEVDEALHGTIAESCPNRPLAEIVERLIRRTAPFRNWRGFEGDCGGLFQERRELIQVLAGNSAARAMELLAAHIRRGAAAVTRK